MKKILAITVISIASMIGLAGIGVVIRLMLESYIAIFVFAGCIIFSVLFFRSVDYLIEQKKNADPHQRPD